MNADEQVTNPLPLGNASWGTSCMPPYQIWFSHFLSPRGNSSTEQLKDLMPTVKKQKQKHTALDDRTALEDKNFRGNHKTNVLANFYKQSKTKVNNTDKGIKIEGRHRGRCNYNRTKFLAPSWTFQEVNASRYWNFILGETKHKMGRMHRT